MIGRGFVTFLDDAALLVINSYIRDGVLARAERGVHVVHPQVIAFDKIATSVAGLGLESSSSPETGSEQSSDRNLLIVSEVVAEGLLPWGEHEIRRKIRAGEIPAVRRKPPYLLDREVMRVIGARIRDEQGAA
jgi:hypothetical protein